MKGALKRLETKNYDEEIEDAQDNLQATRLQLQEQQERCVILKQDLEALNGSCTETQEKINSIPAEVIDIVAISTEIRNKENQVTSLKLKLAIVVIN